MMEIAGVVLGAIPILITALQHYKDTKKLGGRFLNRKKHVEKLIRALREHHGELQSNLDWLLKAIDEEPDQDVAILLKQPDVRQRMVDYLGTGGSDSFESALERAQRTIESIARNIKGFLAEAPGSNNDLDTLVKLYSCGPSFDLKKSFKLVLQEDEVDRKIDELRESTKTLQRLQSIGTAMRQIEATAPSKNSAKVVKSLTRIQSHARRLYKAILLGWSSSCHPTHEARLMLDDRMEASHALRKKLDFKLIFSSDFAAAANLLWYEGHIEVVDEDHDIHITKQQFASPPFSNVRKAPMVTFSPHTDASSQPLAKEVKDICVTITQATQERRPLKWYLMTQQRLHCCHLDHGHAHHTYTPLQFARTVSLTSLLKVSAATTDRSKKLPLRPRLFLALTLASTLVQLNATPWLGAVWSKESIRFLVKTPSRQTSAGQELCKDIDPSQIDLKHPLITEVFHNTSHALPISCDQPEPRRMILELGIMLLELGHERTLEDYALSAGFVVKDDYYERLLLAQRWLDDSEDDFTPTYFNVTARCVKCSFDSIVGRPSWDETLFKGMVQGVVEPLQEECRPRHR